MMPWGVCAKILHCDSYDCQHKCIHMSGSDKEPCKEQSTGALLNPTKSCSCWNVRTLLQEFLCTFENRWRFQLQCFHCDVHVSEMYVWNFICWSFIFIIYLMDLRLNSFFNQQAKSAKNITFTPHLHPRDLNNISILLVSFVRNIVYSPRVQQTPTDSSKSWFYSLV